MKAKNKDYIIYDRANNHIVRNEDGTVMYFTSKEAVKNLYKNEEVISLIDFLNEKTMD